MKPDAAKPSSIIDQVNDALRENPLAATCILTGLAWMLMGASGATSRPAKTVLKKAGASFSGAPKALARAGSSAMERVKGAASDFVEVAASIVPDQKSETGETGDDEGGPDAGNAGKDYVAAARSQLSQAFDAQPLLLGAVGIVVGAGLASALPATALEREAFGDAAVNARDIIATVPPTLKERSQQALGAISEEAERQGLTISTGKDAVSDITEKAKRLGTAAKQAFTEAGTPRPDGSEGFQNAEQKFVVRS